MDLDRAAFISAIIVFGARSFQIVRPWLFDAAVELSIMVIDRQSSLIIPLVLKVNTPNILNLHAARGGAIASTGIGSGPLVDLPIYSLRQVGAFLLVVSFYGLSFYPFNVHIL